MNNMTLNEYQRLASRTANMDHEKVLGRLRQNTRLIELLNFALGAAGEAGELADDVKKVVFHGHELDAKKLQKETGDALWYLSQVAKALGYNLGAVAEANIEKLRQRYPEGFSEEASKARVDTLPTAEGAAEAMRRYNDALPTAEEAVENMREAIKQTDLTPEQRDRIARRFGWGD